MPRLASITSQQLTVAGVSIPLDTTPQYVSLTLDSTDYNEGDTVTATLTTAYVDDDVTVNYTVTGVSANDLSAGSTTGTFTIASNSATATFTLDNDGLTEGVDTFSITLAATDSGDTATGSLTDSATVQDTSNDPTRTPWLDNNDDIITVAQIISPVAMQVNAVFAVNPSVPINVEGRSSGATTIITNIAANTGTLLEVDDDGNSTNFQVGEELNITTENLLTNGDFSSTDLSAYTINPNITATVTNNQLVVDGTGYGFTGTVQQTFDTVPGETYTWTAEIVSSDLSTGGRGGYIEIYNTGSFVRSAFLNDALVAGAGIQTGTFTADNTTAFIRIATRNGETNGVAPGGLITVDNLSVT